MPLKLNGLNCKVTSLRSLTIINILLLTDQCYAKLLKLGAKHRQGNKIEINYFLIEISFDN